VATSDVMGAQLIRSKLGDMEAPADGGDLVRGTVPCWPGRRCVPWLWNRRRRVASVWWRGIVAGTHCGAGHLRTGQNGQLFFTRLDRS
jgi:hypothetical protein